MAVSTPAPSNFTATPVLLVRPLMALVMPALDLVVVLLVVVLENEDGDAIMASFVTSPTSTWAVNVNDVCDEQSETQ